MGGNLEPTPSLEEVEKSIKSMKPGKAAGPDEIPAELLKQLDMGFAPHSVALIKSLYTVQRSNVRVHGQTSDWFTVLKGVRQGCLFSPYLFNIL